jgi:hypothetical protein
MNTSTCFAKGGRFSAALLTVAVGLAHGQAKPAGASAPGHSGALAPKGFSRVNVTPEYKESFDQELRVAVLVAPSYRNSGLNSLKFTLADEVELKGELERQGYKVWLISNTEASADNIRKVLQDSKQLLDGTNQATLVFAFSGHGFQTKGGKNFLMTYGATPDNVEQGALSLDDVEELMTASGARRKVILVDACRNDPEAKSGEEARSFAQFHESEGFSILLSTRPGGFSFEDPELNHGIFTYYLLDGLRGKAAGKDGYVTFYDLQKYVEQSVLAYAMKKDRVQKPFAMGERSGDFLLATAAPPKPDEVAPPPAVSKVSSDTPILRDVGSNRTFFALLSGSDLTLVDAKTLVPMVDAAEKQVSSRADGYRYFEANGANRILYDLAAEVKGDDILSIKGRIGAPCPQGNVCSTEADVPLLPGEKHNEVTEHASAVKNTSNAVSSSLGQLGFGKSAGKAQKTAVVADSAGKTAQSTNKLLTYRWQALNLTAHVPTAPLKAAR